MPPPHPHPQNLNAGFHKAVVEGIEPKKGVRVTFPREEGATLDKGSKGQASPAAGQLPVVCFRA